MFQLEETDADGFTALLLAVSHGRQEMAKVTTSFRIPSQMSLVLQGCTFG